jgi:hypothetical protein
MALQDDIQNIKTAVGNILGYDGGVVPRTQKIRIFEKMRSRLRPIVRGLEEQTDREDRDDAAIQAEIDDAVNNLDT